ncbi:aa3-type cytochrome c oxidase subunit IV [Palleronia sp.]
MAKHSQGSMDITGHEKTFNGFISIITWASVAIVVGLILLWLING